jgi:gamma-glutamyl:cysteine ligase YbdK (ATP-grasp superfamily)
MDVFEGLEQVFFLIERPQLTQSEKALIEELGYSWTGIDIDCQILEITVEVIKVLEASNSVIYNYITKLNALLKNKGCSMQSLYDAVIPPIFGDSI